jgi:hypothetical protein
MSHAVNYLVTGVNRLCCSFMRKDVGIVKFIEGKIPIVYA